MEPCSKIKGQPNKTDVISVFCSSENPLGSVRGGAGEQCGSVLCVLVKTPLCLSEAVQVSSVEEHTEFICKQIITLS